ncbi:TRAP transporter substrate-binding protein DctP [Papillibacter cinnamivorans]|nr:TRAP transporter substrate-binding protein DctP [Papillibacter cinnamivorans]
MLVLTACGGGGSAATATPTPTAAPTAETVKIVWANYGNSKMPPAQGDYDSVKYIEETSGGTIDIDYVPDGVLGGEADMMQQIMDGTIQCVSVGTSTFSTFTSLTEVFQLPCLLTDYNLEYQAFQSDEAQAIFDKVGEDLGVKIVGFSENGIRHFANNVRPITSMADMKGLKLRIAPSNMLTTYMTSIGANPQVVPYAEVYSALQNKVVDGEEINITSIYALKHYEVLKYISEIGLYPFPTLMVFNLDFWNSLTADQQQIILDGMALGGKNVFDNYLPAYEEEALKACTDAGVQINVIEGDAKQEFIDASASVWDEYRAKDPLIANFIDKVESLSK